MDDRNTEYAERYVVNLFEDDSSCHGHMTSPTPAQMYPPRRMLRNRGSRADMSVPALTLLAAMLVPNCARLNASAMKKTPARFPEPPSSRNLERRPRGFQ